MHILNLEQTILLWKLSHPLLLHWAVNNSFKHPHLCMTTATSSHSFLILFLFSSCLLLFIYIYIYISCESSLQTRTPSMSFRALNFPKTKDRIFSTSLKFSTKMIWIYHSNFCVLPLHIQTPFPHLILSLCSRFVINPDWNHPHFPTLYKPFPSLTFCRSTTAWLSLPVTIYFPPSVSTLDEFKGWCFALIHVIIKQHPVTD